MQVPEPLTLTKCDSIMSYGRRFTAGPTETGGNNIITYVSLGGQFLFLAQRGKSAQRLEPQFTSVRALVNGVSKPPSKR